MKINKPKLLNLISKPLSNYCVGDYILCHNIPYELIPHFFNIRNHVPFTIGKMYIITDIVNEKNFLVRDDDSHQWQIIPDEPWFETNILIHDVFKLVKQ